MNIWLLHASEPIPIANKGERLFRMGMIAEELSKRGHQITWFSSTFDHFKKKQLYKKDTILKVKENYNIYLSYAIGYKKNISISRILNHKIIAEKFKNKSKTMEKPDIIYVAFPTIDYAEKAVKYGKKNNVPVIVDIRDLWPDTFYHNLPKYLSILATPYIRWMNHKTIKIMKNAFAINGISDSIVDWGLKKGNRTKSKYDKCFYIGYDNQNSIELNEVSNSVKEKLNKNKFNISFFGTINNQFDYKKIVELAKNLESSDKDIVINICGTGPQIDKLKALVKGISNIQLLGWLNKNELRFVLKNSKIGLAPYKNTFDFQMGVSNKFAEYISFGLPIALTSEGYMKKLLEENECGYSTQDMQKMYEFIIKLKNGTEEYEKMSNNAIKLYEKSFTANKIYKDLVNYLEKIKEKNL